MLTATPEGMAAHILPAKLKDDAIVEALCQLQFTSGDLAEIVIGRITDFASKMGYVAERLPIADIPAPVRHADPNLRFQPTIQLRAKQGPNLIRVGENAVSFHVAGVKQYPGWARFKGQLIEVLDGLFASISNIEVQRISLRYINAIVQDRHYIGDIHQLEFEAHVGKVALNGPINLNFIVQGDPDHSVTTRLAHMKFVQGVLPPNTSAVIDVEVSTNEKFVAKKAVEVLAWVEIAHDLEKEAFFALIPNEILIKLTE